jgi:hypothetical protein
MNSIRYHIHLNSHRTTISMDKIISDLLAIKLGMQPGTKEARSAVRKQLEKFMGWNRGRTGIGLARYITEEAVLFISDKVLSEQYFAYASHPLKQNEPELLANNSSHEFITTLA